MLANVVIFNVKISTVMKKIHTSLVFVSAVTLLSSLLSADTYTATSAISDWNDAAAWGAPVLSGNDFVYSPAASSAELKATSVSFSGDTLTIAGGLLEGGSFDINQDLTFEDYGAFRNGKDNGVHSGTWTVNGSGIYKCKNRLSTIMADVTGFGSFWIAGGSNSGSKAVTINATAFDDFDGVVKVAYDTGISNATAAAKLVFNGDVTAPGLSIELGHFMNGPTKIYSKIDLNHTISLGALALDGIALDVGVYTYSDLTPEQQAYFIDNGGTLIIAPADAPTGTLIEVSALDCATPQVAG